MYAFAFDKAASEAASSSTSTLLHAEIDDANMHQTNDTSLCSCFMNSDHTASGAHWRDDMVRHKDCKIDNLTNQDCPFQYQVCGVAQSGGHLLLSCLFLDSSSFLLGFLIGHDTTADLAVVLPILLAHAQSLLAQIQQCLRSTE